MRPEASCGRRGVGVANSAPTTGTRATPPFVDGRGVGVGVRHGEIRLDVLSASSRTGRRHPLPRRASRRARRRLCPNALSLLRTRVVHAESLCSSSSSSSDAASGPPARTASDICAVAAGGRFMRSSSSRILDSLELADSRNAFSYAFAARSEATAGGEMPSGPPAWGKPSREFMA